MKCFQNLYSEEKMSQCEQLETNEIRRIFHYYDPSNILILIELNYNISNFNNNYSYFLIKKAPDILRKVI